MAPRRRGLAAGACFLASIAAGLGCQSARNDLGFDREIVSGIFGQAGETSQSAAGSSGTAGCGDDCQSEPPDAGGDDLCGDDCAPENCTKGTCREPPDASVTDPCGADCEVPDAGDSIEPPPEDAAPETDAAAPTVEVRAPYPLLAPLPNHFVDLLGVTEAETATRLEAAFQHYFHGDPTTEAIYQQVDDEHAFILDVLHADTRADALGYGLIVAVELDHKTEFDNIWRFTYERLRIASGPAQGYFYERCDLDGNPCPDRIASYGAFHITTALLLAEARWGNGAAVLDYGAQARAQLEALRGVVPPDVAPEERPLLFALDEYLPGADASAGGPVASQAGIAIPAFFEYWGTKSGDAFWLQVADQSRSFFVLAAHPTTGLVPQRSYFDGAPVDDDPLFNENSYGYLMNLALDNSWYGVEPSEIELADRLVRFFANFDGQGLPSAYALSGMPASQNSSGALAAAVGGLAGTTTLPARTALARGVWETPLSSGLFRYFDGTLHLMSLLYLSGNYRGY